MRTSVATVFGLLRHGQTVWNTEKRIQGSGDSPLTEEGMRNSRLWGEKLRLYPFTRIVASDLGRVRQTAAIINHSLTLPLQFEPRLREQSWGEWEGLRIEDIHSNHQAELERRVALGWDFSAPGGETRNQVVKRCLQAFAELTATCAGEKLLILCHQGVIKCLCYHLTGRAFLPGEDPLLQVDRLHLLQHDGVQLQPLRLNVSKDELP